MALAHAIRDDEDLLICDMAETYHIYDYKALPATLLVTLFCGLGPNSRLGRKADGVKVPLDLMLHAAIFDKLALLVHVHEKKGTPPPGRGMMCGGGDRNLEKPFGLPKR